MNGKRKGPTGPYWQPPLGQGERSRSFDRKALSQLVWLAFGENTAAKAVEFKGRVHLGAARMSSAQFQQLLRLRWCEWSATSIDEDWIELTEEGRRARDTWVTK